MNIPTINIKDINNFNSIANKNGGHSDNLDFSEGEIVRVKLLEYLGGGKMVIDLKGQRIVANSNLMLEKGQELDVLIRNFNGNKIVLQIVQNKLFEKIQNQNKNFSINDSIRQLKLLINNIDFQSNPLLNEKIKRIPQLLDNVYIQLANNTKKEDISNQIRNSLSMFGYDYENKISDAIEKGNISDFKFNNQIKAELLRLENEIIEILESSESSRNTKNLDQLFLSINGLIEHIESYQAKSLVQSDELIHILFALPMFFDDQETTVEFDYSHPQNKSDEESNYNISIKFELDNLGKIEFIVNLSEKKLNCLINFNDQETYMLAKNHTKELEKNFATLGYDVNNLYCMMRNIKTTLSQNNVNLIDTNI